MITTVLIAEDDPMMAHLYQKVFTLEGYLVVMTGNGQEALDKARESKPTIIILDVMMPVLNGLDALSQFKRDPQLQNIPVIMLTNLAGQQDAETAIAKGAVKYVIKSEHDPREVATIVKDVLAAAPAIVGPSPVVAAPSAPAVAPTAPLAADSAITAPIAPSPQPTPVTPPPPDPTQPPTSP